MYFRHWDTRTHKTKREEKYNERNHGSRSVANPIKSIAIVVRFVRSLVMDTQVRSLILVQNGQLDAQLLQVQSCHLLIELRHSKKKKNNKRN